MIDRIAKDLNLERYVQLLQRIARADYPVALCDAAGQPVTATDGSADSRISSALHGDPSLVLYRL